MGNMLTSQARFEGLASARKSKNFKDTGVQDEKIKDLTMGTILEL